MMVTCESKSRRYKALAYIGCQPSAQQPDIPTAIAFATIAVGKGANLFVLWPPELMRGAMRRLS
jgi:hypothetical protein